MAATHYLLGVFLLALVVCGQEGFGKEQESNSLGAMEPFFGALAKSQFPCEFCKEIVEFLKNVSTDPDTLDGIEKVLLSLCDWIPYALHEECIKYVDQIPSILKELADEYLNGTVCCAHLCHPRMDVQPYRFPDAVKLMNLIKPALQKKPLN